MAMLKRASVFARTVVAISLLLFCGYSYAGPPYITDDPVPTDLGHWEDYLFVTGVTDPGTIAGQAGVELNYGAAKDLQLSVTLPLNYDNADSLRTGSGDLLLGAKYRFLEHTDGSWLPDVAFFPQLSLSTESRMFGPQHPNLFLPFWMQRDFGKWSTFGGFGYDIYPGKGNQNYELIGWAVTRSITDQLNLGTEIYHQTASTVGGRSLTNVALGVVYQFTQHWAFMASGGPGLENTRINGQYSFYASIQLLY
jgi:hypothetical protein